MNFRDVEMFAYVRIDEIMLVVVELHPSLIEFSEGVGSMGFEMSIINEVEGCADNANEAGFSLANENTKKHLLHVFVFCSGPLRNEGYTLLEVVQISAMGHGLEMLVDLCLAAIDSLGSPFYYMVLEDAFMELVKYIGSEAGEYVTMREIRPERIGGAKALFIKIGRIAIARHFGHRAKSRIMVT